jgi:hypothetical protein
MGDVTDFRGRKPGSELAQALEKVEAARSDADQIGMDIGYLAAILEIVGLNAGEPLYSLPEGRNDEPWLRVEYLGHQLARHARDLGSAHEKIEVARMAAQRAIEAAPAEDGGAA